LRIIFGVGLFSPLLPLPVPPSAQLIRADPSRSPHPPQMFLQPQRELVLHTSSKSPSVGFFPSPSLDVIAQSYCAVFDAFPNRLFPIIPSTSIGVHYVVRTPPLPSPVIIFPFFLPFFVVVPCIPTLLHPKRFAPPPSFSHPFF